MRRSHPETLPAASRPATEGYAGFSASAALSRDPRVQLLGLLRRFGALTRAELAAHLGVTTAMVGEWIAGLKRARLVEDAGKGESRGGRPPQRVRLAGAAALAIGLDMSGWPVRAVVRNLAGELLFEATFPAASVAELAMGQGSSRRTSHASDSGPRHTAAEVEHAAANGAGGTLALPPTSADAIARIIEQVLQRSGLARRDVRAAGVALAGFVDTRRGTHRPKGVAGAESTPLAAQLSERLGIPVLIEDMARAAALAEARDGAAAGIADLLFLSLGDRIGAALILNGELYRGATGIVGELGHIVVNENGQRCTCGNVGCVQAQASRAAILRQVREALDAGVVSSVRTTAAGLDLETIVEAAARGDRLAASVLRQAGRDVGRALAAGANLLGPAMIVLGGYAPRLGDLFLEEVRRELAACVVPPILEQMSIGLGVVGEAGAALGAAWGALDLLVESGALVQPGAHHQRRRRRAPLATAATASAPDAPSDSPVVYQSAGL